jgi:hypothetical protein
MNVSVVLAPICTVTVPTDADAATDIDIDCPTRPAGAPEPVVSQLLPLNEAAAANSGETGAPPAVSSDAPRNVLINF